MAKDTRNYKDRAEYLKKAVTKRRKRLREKAIDYKDGKCHFCGYKKYSGALEFHHIDPKQKQKDFGLSARGFTRSWKKIEDEINKCILVCSNCHKEIHAGLLQPSAEMLK